MTPEELEGYLARNIPLSAAMGVRVVDAGPDRILLEAPLEPNLNHRATAFGGSVATLAILAGWALVHRNLRASGREAQTVIHSSRTDYLAPVRSAFRACCGPVDPSGWDRLVRSVERRGMGRIRVPVVVTCEESTVARFEGAYVALAPGPDI